MKKKINFKSKTINLGYFTALELNDRKKIDKTKED